MDNVAFERNAFERGIGEVDLTTGTVREQSLGSHYLTLCSFLSFRIRA